MCITLTVVERVEAVAVVACVAHAVGVELGRGNARYPHLRAAVADLGELLCECLDEPLDGRVVGLVDCGVGGGLRPQPKHAVDSRVV